MGAFDLVNVKTYKFSNAYVSLKPHIINEPRCAYLKTFEDKTSDILIEYTFYSEIPLPFPNSSYLLEPSNPMANAEMRF